MSTESDALNRIADALFTQAKVQRLQVRVAERQCKVAESMAEMQKANLATTKALESALTGKVHPAISRRAADV